MKKILLLFCVLYSVSLFAKTGEAYDEGPEATRPWFTGPLLTPSAYVVPYGFVNLEPYVYGTITRRHYDNHGHTHSVPKFVSINPQLTAQIGVSKKVNFSFFPQFYYNKREGKESVKFGDLPIAFAFQCYLNKPEDFWPAVKLTIQENLPTGNYQKLDPKKNRTDVTGSGSFATSAAFTFGKKAHFGGWHWLSARLQLGYTYFAPVHVRSYNTYGGGHGTAGKVFPGNQYLAQLGLEYCLTRNWVLAMDVEEVYRQKNRFKGQSIAPVGSPHSQQFSLAPAIEYNFSEKHGLIFGPWFTVFGRNASDFMTWTLAYNYYN